MRLGWGECRETEVLRFTGSRVYKGGVPLEKTGVGSGINIVYKDNL